MRPLEAIVDAPANNGILQRLGKVDELRAVSGYADQEVFVIFRMLLRFEERFRRQGVELYVEGAHIEEGLYHSGQVASAPFRLDQVVA